MFEDQILADEVVQRGLDDRDHDLRKESVDPMNC